jgi:hypothetical protein
MPILMPFMDLKPGMPFCTVVFPKSSYLFLLHGAGCIKGDSEVFTFNRMPLKSVTFFFNRDYVYAGLALLPDLLSLCDSNKPVPGDSVFMV